MPLFQSTILQKYTNALDTATVDGAYERFSAHFLNPVIQENIRLAKEEQYQGEFLIDLFVKVLGFVKNPTPEFNLTTEFKNIKDSKKADGAIIKGETALGVIELKGTAVTDLGRIEVQAFGYKNNQPGCVYVITSNFEKLRFYIDNAVDFEEFNLFQLSRERFNVLWLCLSSEQLLAGKPKQLKEESLSQEEQITKQLYKDYSLFRNEVFQSIVDNNPQYDKLTLFKETQKLLDRFLFIFFAEDRLLLPPNSILAIVQQWKDLRDKYDAYTPLYDRFKKYFGYLNTGHKGQKHDIFAYNGGLFTPDPILDDLTIDDDLLYKHTVKLTHYDFESEVSVNILGHIFEHSLNEIEEIQAELEGQVVDKSTSKRKKDGVFYTPKYITKYIVDNTVGKLCEEQKTALDIEEAEYDKGRKNRPVKVVKALKQKLDDYRAWLLQLTICDPACGSGAFLNQALEFLIAEHAYVDELQAKLFGDAMVLSDVENSILEHNLYGVDINNESVEIAKLSLWLRTAQKGRKLTSLNNNIKCGNSLIDDPAVAGDKAFDWEKEFPQVFVKGGFDVVIGNPPYVRKQGLMEHYPEMCEYYERQFQSATANYDIYALFMERSFDLIHPKGIVSYILPHKFLVTDFGEGIRKFFIEKKAVKSLLHFGSDMVFSDASTYTCIINLDKSVKDKVYFKKINPLEISLLFDWDYMLYDNLSANNWDLQSQKVFDVIDKLKQQPYTIESVFENIFQGIATSLDAVYVFEGLDVGGFIKAYNAKYDYHFEIEKDFVKPFIKGNEISKYKNLENIHYVFFPYATDGTPANELYIKNNLPKTYSYLKHFENEIKGRERGRMNIDEGWFLYIYPKNLNKFHFPKIMTQEISMGCNMTFDEEGVFYHPTTIYSFVKRDKFEVDDKYYLGIMNSKVMWFFLKNTGTELRGGYFRFKTNYLKPFPLPRICENSAIMVEKVNKQLSNNKLLQSAIESFLGLLKSKFSIEKFTTNLQSWHTLDFKGFLKELKKAKVSLTLPEEAKWMTYFNGEKEKAQALQNEIDRLDKEIDGMVYGLYGLTEEEIKIVEGS